MLQIDILAAGRMKDKAMLSLFADYSKRLQWGFTLHEIEGKNTADEQEKLTSKIDPHAYLFVLDERGKSLGSIDFSKKIDDLAAGGTSKIQFMVGGADGLNKDIRKKADFLLSFGIQTWPHMLVRIMLIEQIYRAQQILAGHPYHRV